ncbi:MAG: HAD-IB family phosphatase [Ardenticatenaceae bacterium]|nr:HAD-IB family phosphatase [Ardenticatenaceae bacterium]
MRWPHYEHIFFDCDSTLTAVEGIDILADTDEKKREIAALTQAAMDGKLDLEDIYARRLQTINPTHEQIREIRRVYKRNIVEDATEVIAALHEQGHKVYIISGGLAEPVEEFGIYLGVPRQRIRAVNVRYNQLDGNWWQSDNDNHYLTYQKGALTVSDGKAQIVRELLAGQYGRSANGRSLLIGDGNSDLLAGTAVDLFIGYGGVTVREQVLAQAAVYIHSRSLAPLLALAAGPAALKRLPNQNLAQKAVQIIHHGGITFQDEALNQKFRKACQSVYPQAVKTKP